MSLLKYIISAFALLLTAVLVVPEVLPGIDSEQFRGNFRIPYSQGEDYFLFEKYTESLTKGKKIALIGDSVIWGHYTKREDTLSAVLNRKTGGDDFFNLGIYGIHPAALYGLIDRFAPSLHKRKIIAGVNPLWMSSKRHDLTGEKNSEINHRRLLPQFSPSIPSYDANCEEKISHIIKKTVPFFSWLEHIKLARFADSSFYRWTMDNPGKNPAEFIKKSSAVYSPPSKMKGRSVRQNVRWVSAEKSLQWRYMLRTLKELKDRGNSVIAVITPYNTASLTPESHKLYAELTEKMKSDLTKEGIAFICPTALKEKNYADASHPDSEGYKILGDRLIKSEELKNFLSL